MKNVFLILAMFVATSAAAQLEVNTQKDSVLFERTGVMAGNPLKIMYFEEFESFSMFYRTAEYTHITVIEVLRIGSEENLKQLMELCLKSAETKEEFETSLYHISRFSKKAVRIWATEGYFYISTKECQEILDALK